jgi:hypothetical protein
MSTQIPSYFSHFNHSNLYIFPTHTYPKIALSSELTKAFDTVLNFILLNESNESLSEILDVAFDHSFQGSMYSLVQIHEWTQQFFASRDIVGHENETQIALAFHSFIYENYVKKTFPVSYLDFCSTRMNLQCLLPLEEQNPGLMLVLGDLIALKKLPLTTPIHNLYKSGKECTEICLKFLCDSLEPSDILRLIHVFKPTLPIPLPKEIGEKLLCALEALAKVNMKDSDEFWKWYTVFEDFKLTTSKQKNLFISLACEALSKDLSSVDKLSPHILSEIIKSPFLLENKFESSKSEIAILAVCIGRLELLDRQKLDEALAIDPDERNLILTPFLITQCTGKEFKIRLLQCVESMQKGERKKFYSTVKMLCEHKAYADVPLPLILALALASSENRGFSYKAYSLWMLHAEQLSSELKLLFGRVFIRKLAVVEPTLAIEILESLINPSLPPEKWLDSLKELMTAFKKESVLSPNVLNLLAMTLKKILENLDPSKNIQLLSSENCNAIQWLILELVKHNYLKEANELWWIIYKSSKPEMPFFSELLFKPFEKNKSQLLNNFKHTAFYDNPESALAFLSLIKPTPAICWKILFEKCKPLKDKEFCLKVWKEFTKCIENREELQGTPQEITETWLLAVKMIAQKHSPVFLDIFGKEPLLFSFFDNSEMGYRQACAKIVYEKLLDICEEIRPNIHMESLLKFRIILEKSCAMPLGKCVDLKLSDLRLSDMLSRSSTKHFQVVAFKAMVVLEDDQNAAKILSSLLSFHLVNSESKSLAPLLPLFLSRLAMADQAAALKLLQSPTCSEVLTHNPEKSLEMLYACHKIMAESIHFKLAFLKLGFALAPHLKSDRLFLWAEELVSYLDSQNALSSKSEIRQQLPNHLNLVMGIVNKEEDLFKLLKAIKRLSIKVVPANFAIEPCLNMLSSLATTSKNLNELQTIFLWFKDFIKTTSHSKNLIIPYLNLIHEFYEQNKISEAEPLLTGFFDLIKTNQFSSSNFNPISTKICYILLKKAAASESPEKMKAGWHLFWDIFIKYRLVNPAQCSNCWGLITESFCARVPEISRDILSQPEYFIEVFKECAVDSQTAKNIELLLSNSILSLENMNSAEGEQLIESWLKSSLKLEEYGLANPDLNKRLSLAVSALSIITGNHSQYIYSDLARNLSNNPNDILLVTRWLFKIFTSAPEPRKIQILEAFFISIYHPLMCKWLDDQDHLPQEVKSLYSLIFYEKWISFNHFLTIIHGIMEEPHKQQPHKELLEKAFISIVEKLKTQALPLEEKRPFVEFLNQFLIKSSNDKFPITSDFYSACLKKPILDFEIIEDKELTENTARNLIKFLFAYIRKNSSQFGSITNLLEEYTACSEQCEQYEHLLGEDNLFLPFCYFEAIISTNNKFFVNKYNQVKERVIRKLIEKNPAPFKDPDYFQEQSLKFQSEWIKKLASVNFVNLDSFYAFNHILGLEFAKVMAHHEVINSELLACFDQFVFGFSYSYLKDLHYNGEAASHFTAIKSIVSQVAKSNAFPDSKRLFQYCCLYNTDLDMVSKKLTKEEKQVSFHELVDRLGASVSYIGVDGLLNLATRIYQKKCDIGPKEIAYCWETAFTTAAKLKNDTAHQISRFEVLLTRFVGSEIPKDANQILEWKAISINICDRAFTELCNLQNPIYLKNSPASQRDLMIQASRWLTLFWIKGCFSGHFKAYYKFVDKLISMCRLNPNDSLTSLAEINELMMDLIELPRKSKGGCEELYTITLAKWCSMFAPCSGQK